MKPLKSRLSIILTDPFLLPTFSGTTTRPAEGEEKETEGKEAVGRGFVHPCSISPPHSKPAARMDTAHWPQNFGLMKPLPSMQQMGVAAPNTTNDAATCSTARPPPPPQLSADRRSRPPKEQALNCPRCNSTNTKFCYYNNYSLTQPRYFCKTCRRYWTEGGSLRNVPVGGGSRKNKRSSSSSSSSTATTTTSAAPMITAASQPNKLPSFSTPPLPPTFNPKSLYEPQDLNLGYQQHRPAGDFGEFRHSTTTGNSNSPTCSAAAAVASTAGLSAVELLRSGIPARGLMSPFIQMPMSADSDGMSVYQPGMFGLQGFRPASFSAFPANSVSELNAAYCNSTVQGVQEGGGGGGGRVVFPFEDLSQAADAAEFEQNRGHGGAGASGFWSTGAMGMGGGGPAAW